VVAAAAAALVVDMHRLNQWAEMSRDLIPLPVTSCCMITAPHVLFYSHAFVRVLFVVALILTLKILRSPYSGRNKEGKQENKNMKK